MARREPKVVELIFHFRRLHWLPWAKHQRQTFAVLVMAGHLQAAEHCGYPPRSSSTTASSSVATIAMFIAGWRACWRSKSSLNRTGPRCPLHNCHRSRPHSNRTATRLHRLPWPAPATGWRRCWQWPAEASSTGSIALQPATAATASSGASVVDDDSTAMTATAKMC